MYDINSFFVLREVNMGYDFNLAQNLADFLNLELDYLIAGTFAELEAWLSEGRIDIIACNTVKTKPLKEKFQYVLPQNESYMVLVQQVGRNALSNVTELKNKDVHVRENSIYHHRLKALNDEIGGGINIVFSDDSLSNIDIMNLAVQNKIPYTIAYYNKADLYRQHYPNIDCRLQVGFYQQNGWLISQENQLLADTINHWLQLNQTQKLERNLYRTYWERNPFLASQTLRIPHGAISPYDDLFKKYAAKIDWNWKLLAALIFVESGYDSLQVSPAGALGLMQLMPQTATVFDLTEENAFNPEENIKAGIEYIKYLDRSFRKRVPNKDERIKFILASYNSGPAHIYDAMALAEKYGKNPTIWFENVEYFLLKKNESEFYEDTVVKYGKFRGVETVNHVQRVFKKYEDYLRRTRNIEHNQAN